MFHLKLGKLSFKQKMNAKYISVFYETQQDNSKNASYGTCLKRNEISWADVLDKEYNIFHMKLHE